MVVRKQLIQCIIIGVFFTSCDCLQEVSGTVVDRKTGIPLDSVSFQSKLSIGLIYTDTSGFFYSYGTSGGLFGCPPKKFILRKPGYKTKRVMVANGTHKIVKMTRIKIKYDLGLVRFK